MNLIHLRWMHRLAVVLLVAASPLLLGDTVYLKNGAWIDGRVRLRNEKILEIEIGQIGKMEVNLEEIHEIEKNNRTGEDFFKRRDSIDRPGLAKEGNKLVPAASGAGENSEAGAEEAEGEASPAGSPKAKGDGAASASASGSSKEPAPLDPELKERIEQLVDDLERQKPQYRVRAERHLKAIGVPTLPFLLPLAESKSDLTRISVLRLFRDFGDETVIEACVQALLDSNEHVRQLANEALGRVTHQDFGFKAEASPRRREMAHEKWKKWWDAEKSEMEHNRALSTGNS